MPIITLLSDFGPGDASLAVAKGTFLRKVPDAFLVDVCHQVDMMHYQQAAYLVRATWRAFPAGTVHVMLFNVFSERRPSLMLCEAEGHYFLAPDNGLLPLVFSPAEPASWQCCAFEDEDPLIRWLEGAGDAISHLQHTGAADAGYAACALRPAPELWMPHYENNVIECHIIHIDRYENVIINLTREQFEKWGGGRPFRIEFSVGETINVLSTHYHDVPNGKKLGRFNSVGYLEIAINQGPAASLFGFKLMREKHVFYKSIKIYFE